MALITHSPYQWTTTITRPFQCTAEGEEQEGEEVEEKTDVLEVKFEVEGLCVKSSDSPIDFTTVTEMGNGNNNNNEIEASGCSKTLKRRHYELRSMVSRRVHSQLSTTAEHIKPEVSTVSDLTQVPTNKAMHRLQRPKSVRRGHRKYGVIPLCFFFVVVNFYLPLGLWVELSAVSRLEIVL